MAVKLSPFFNDAQLDNNGLPLVGGLVYWYLAGTTTPVNTYTDVTGATPQANPVVLNIRGEPTNPIWLTTGAAYKATLKNSTGSTIRTIDNISGIDDVAALSISEWALMAAAASYISASSFSVVGDQTGILTENRRLKATVTGGTYYGTIVTAIFGAGITTVTTANDSIALDAGLASISYAILAADHPSVPNLYVLADSVPALLSRTGEGIWWFGTTPRSGTLAVNGDTIGSATSGSVWAATTYQDLFNLLWAQGTDTTCPMLTSAGGASSRGANAAADWAANKRLTLPYVLHGQTVLQSSGDLGQQAAGSIIAHAHGFTYDRTTGSNGLVQGGVDAPITRNNLTITATGSSTDGTGGSYNYPAGSFWLFCIFY